MDKDTNVKEKTKSPGRVAWGKKLSELKKQERLNKLSNLSEDIKQKQVTETNETDRKDNSSNIFIWATAGSIVIGLLALYYQRKTAVLTEKKCQITPVVKESAGSKCFNMQ